MMSITKVLFTFADISLKNFFRLPSNWLSIADIDVITSSRRITIKLMIISDLTNCILLRYIR